MNSIVLEIRNDLLNQWIEVEQNIDRMITTKLSEVSYWKFASDEYYTHLPYFHEINKFKKGRILKNITKSELGLMNNNRIKGLRYEKIGHAE